MRKNNLYQKTLLYIKDFWRPVDIGAFYDGKDIIYDERSSFFQNKTGRVYLSLSHSCLYFQTINFPVDLSDNQLESSIIFEILRSLDLEDEKSLSFTILTRKNNHVLVSFQKKDFLENIVANIPNFWLVSGVFPSFLSILAWFYHKNKSISDGVYYIMLDDAVEGFVWQDGELSQVLPSNKDLANRIINEYSGDKFEIKSKNPAVFLANASRLVYRLPQALVRSFNDFPLRKRPDISPKLLILWFLPVLLLGTNFFLDQIKENYLHEESQLRGRLKKLQFDYESLISQKKKQENLSLLKKEILQFKKQPDLLYSLLVITNSLSSDAWIRKFEFRYPNEIRIWGEGKDALAILKKLQSTDHFLEVKFLSTVSKNLRTQKEYFAISLKLK